MEAKFIKIGETTYPCRLTMGALRRFKQLTGKEVTEVDMESVVTLSEFIFCCIASACHADKIQFALTIDDFCDAISPDDLASMAGAFMEKANGPEAEKKSV